MNQILNIPENELQLARLAAVKLSRVLEGMFTTGTGAMLLLPSFLATNECKLTTALIEVLRGTECRTGSEPQTKLAAQTDELTVLFSRFYGIFTRLANWREMQLETIEATVGELAAVYWAMMEALRRFLEFLELPVDFSREDAIRRALPAGFLQEVRAIRSRRQGNNRSQETQKET
jgi:hypothetical protein